jgi:hypothetical protein
MATLKRCTGLITHPNELLVRDGALEIADNVVIDADDTIESRRGFAEFGDQYGTGTDRIKQLLVYKDRVFRHSNSTIQYDSTGLGDFLSLYGAYTETETGLRIKSLETNGNLYFTTSTGIKKISATSASSFTTASGFVTNAGGVKAYDISAELSISTGGFLPPESKCAYRMLWAINDSNNLTISGTPSSRFVLTNNSKDILTPEKFNFLFTSGTVTDYDGTASNRYLTVNSKDNGYFIWFSTTAFPNRPNDANTIDRTEIKVNIQGLTTSADIAAAAANAVANTITEYTVELSGSTITFTSTETGEDVEDPTVSSALTVVTLTIEDQGTIAAGTNANAEVSFIIPEEITSTSYYYQIYRTAPITVDTGLTLDDIDPGDEMSLVIEDYVTDADLLAGTITVEDITTEQFRASGTPLYTNPNTGEGILQANERPPIAKDIALFRNSVFYSNTKTSHKKQFSLLSVSAMTSGVSTLVIGNQNEVAEFTFVGSVESSDIVCDSYTNTVDTGYILLNSASNERKYYLWIDKGSTSDPNIAGRTGIRVEILSGDSSSTVATKVKDALEDFSATVLSSTVTVSNYKNGKSDDLTMPASLGGTWAVSVVSQGDGEDYVTNQILLSSLVSVGQSIEETARSLVRVVNKDSNCPVNASYLSSEGDLPGIILLESRELSDVGFYVATGDPSIISSFNPALASVETITAITASNPAQITTVGHGLSTGEEVFIYGTDSTPAISGAYKVTVLSANTFSVPVTTVGVGTSGFWYKTSFKSDNEVSPNRLYFSKIGQPEAVPVTNYLDIGPKDKQIKRILALRDNLFVLKEDGVYIISGTSAPNFSSRLLDGTVGFSIPDSAVTTNNAIYSLTSEGVVSVTESGTSVISRPIEDLILKITNSRYPNYPTISFAVSYESDRSYLLWMPSSTSDTYATQCYRYNIFTDTWTRWTFPAMCGTLNSGVDKLYVGHGSSNFAYEERKNGDRTDYADKEFLKTLPTNSIDGEYITPDSISDIEIGDVIYQLQYVTMYQVDKLLLKLDSDLGLSDSDYYNTLSPSSGDALNSVLDALNAKLVIDDVSGIITTRSFSTDFLTMQQDFNDLIGELNNLSSDTSFKDYSLSEDTVPHEAIVIEVDRRLSRIKTSHMPEFIEGSISIFKGIKTDVQWAPQHFGNSETLKQVREGTVIFDQASFYSGSILYASDRSNAFDQVDFTLGSIGAFGADAFGENVFGGLGNEIPVRTLIPREKQRCRHIRVRFKHINARETFRILGISLEPRELSTRAYR